MVTEPLGVAPAVASTVATTTCCPTCGCARGIDTCTTGVALVTVKERVTVGAAFQSSLPAWLASIVQVPCASRVTVVPTTEHTSGVSDVKLTGRPDEALA